MYKHMACETQTRGLAAGPPLQHNVKQSSRTVTGFFVPEQISIQAKTVVETLIIDF